MQIYEYAHNIYYVKLMMKMIRLLVKVCDMTHGFEYSLHIALNFTHRVEFNLDGLLLHLPPFFETRDESKISTNSLPAALIAILLSQCID